MADTSEDRLLSYRIETAEKRSIRFVIDNATVYPDGQMGNNRYTLMDQYGNLICTVCQDNQEKKGILELDVYKRQGPGRRCGSRYERIRDISVGQCMFRRYVFFCLWREYSYLNVY